MAAAVASKKSVEKVTMAMIEAGSMLQDLYMRLAPESKKETDLDFVKINLYSYTTPYLAQAQKIAEVSCL